MLQEVIISQDKIRAVLAEAEAILVRSGDFQALELGAIRWRTADLIKKYVDLKHATVFPSLLSSPDIVVSTLAGEMKRRCDAMGDFYKGYLSKWTALGVLEDKAGYRSAALDLIGRLRRHFDRESTDISRLTEMAQSPRSGVISASVRG